MTYYPLSGYKIDGYDTYGTWKIHVAKITGLHQFLTRKGEISQSWPDSDGEEAFTNSSDIYFDGNDVIMHCYLRTSSMDPAFLGFLSSFRTRLEMAGMRTLTVPYTTTTYSLMYVKGSDIEWLTPKRNSSQCIGRFWIQFRQTTPVRG
jgi:hypothetical protein